jgi:4-hydroxyphenylpyruvate dioxygenase
MTKTKNTQWENPMGTAGFEFVEYSSPEPLKLEKLFIALGFTLVATHKSKQVKLFRQGDINFILNAQPGSYAEQFHKKHGPCACALGFRVQNALEAYKKAVSLNARPHNCNPGFMELNIPAVEGVGGALLFFINLYGEHNIYQIDFDFINHVDMSQNSVGLHSIDHVTHNVMQGGMDRWAHFYENLFNFKETRYFDIKGSFSGLYSRAMTSPDGQIRIPINESADDKSQIAEFIQKYNGSGIQHIALATDNIYKTVQKLRANGIDFLNTPDAYYNMIDNRLPGHNEDIPAMQKNKILVDGDPQHNQGLLLQIFTNTCIGPIFFEIIQRKGNTGFGEGNFQALFESIEQDQVERGTL